MFLFLADFFTVTVLSKKFFFLNKRIIVVLLGRLSLLFFLYSYSFLYVYCLSDFQYICLFVFSFPLWTVCPCLTVFYTGILFLTQSWTSNDSSMIFVYDENYSTVYTVFNKSIYISVFYVNLVWGYSRADKGSHKKVPPLVVLFPLLRGPAFTNPLLVVRPLVEELFFFRLSSATIIPYVQEVVTHFI